MCNSVFRLNKKLLIFRIGELLQFSQVLHGFTGTGAAHLSVRAQAAADRRTPVAAEQEAEFVFRQLDTAYASRFAGFHAGDR